MVHSQLSVHFLPQIQTMYKRLFSIFVGMDPKQQEALYRCHRDILKDLDIDKKFLLSLYIENIITESQMKDIEVIYFLI